MRMSIRILGFALFLALHVLCGVGLHAAAPASDTTSTDTTSAAPTATAPQPGSPADSVSSTQQADTSKAAASSAKPVDRFAPVSTSYATSTSNDITLGSRMNVRTMPGKGWTLTNGIAIERKRHRTRDMEDLSESATNRADKEHAGLYTLSFGIGDTYRKSKTLGLGRYGQDIIYDTQAADVAVELTKAILGASTSRFSVIGRGSRGLNDFKYDRSLFGSASASMKYLFGNILSVRGGAGTSMRRESSDIGPRRFGPIPSNGDTLSAGLSYARETSALDVAYMRYTGLDRKVTPPRGNTYEILNDPSKAKQEKTTNVVEQLNVVSKIAPFPFLGLDVSFERSIRDQKYAVDTMLTNRTKQTSISAAANYRYAAGGAASVNVSTSDDLSDWSGSLSSFRERQYAVNMGVVQMIGDSVSISASGAGSLKQRFYLKQTANPRDADYLYYHGDCSFRAPFKKIAAAAMATVERYETINIDMTLSGDNRIDYKYQVGPTITVRPSNWVTITQDYLVKIEFTDFVYREDKNYLNRTTTLNTQTSFSLFPALMFSIRNSYLMKDTGSYLMRTGGRRYRPSNNTHENILDIQLGYNLSTNFTLKAAGNFRVQRNDVFGAQEGHRIIIGSSTYESGGMKLGFERTKKFADLGDIDLDVTYVRNYGPYITEQRREYVEANSTITLRF
jgi:hypothetical protein